MNIIVLGLINVLTLVVYSCYTVLVKVLSDIIITILITLVGAWGMFTISSILSKFVNDIQAGMPSGLFW
jgi:hypothetical protein